MIFRGRPRATNACFYEGNSRPQRWLLLRGKARQLRSARFLAPAVGPLLALSAAPPPAPLRPGPLCSSKFRRRPHPSSRQAEPAAPPARQHSPSQPQPNIASARPRGPGDAPPSPCQLTPAPSQALAAAARAAARPSFAPASSPAPPCVLLVHSMTLTFASAAVLGPAPVADGPRRRSSPAASRCRCCRWPTRRDGSARPSARPAFPFRVSSLCSFRLYGVSSAPSGARRPRHRGPRAALPRASANRAGAVQAARRASALSCCPKGANFSVEAGWRATKRIFSRACNFTTSPLLLPAASPSTPVA